MHFHIIFDPNYNKFSLGSCELFNRSVLLSEQTAEVLLKKFLGKAFARWFAVAFPAVSQHIDFKFVEVASNNSPTLCERQIFYVHQPSILADGPPD